MTDADIQSISDALDAVEDNVHELRGRLRTQMSLRQRIVFWFTHSQTAFAPKYLLLWAGIAVSVVVAVSLNGARIDDAREVAVTSCAGTQQRVESSRDDNLKQLKLQIAPTQFKADPVPTEYTNPHDLGLLIFAAVEIRKQAIATQLPSVNYNVARYENSHPLRCDEQGKPHELPVPKIILPDLARYGLPTTIGGK